MGNRRSAGNTGMPPRHATSQPPCQTQPSTLGGTARWRGEEISSEPGSRIDEVARRAARLVAGWVAHVSQRAGKSRDAVAVDAQRAQSAQRGDGVDVLETIIA